MNRLDETLHGICTLHLTIICTSISAAKKLKTTYAATVQNITEVNKGCMQEDGLRCKHRQLSRQKQIPM